MATIEDFRTTDPFTARYQPYDVQKIRHAAAREAGIDPDSWETFDAQQALYANLPAKWQALVEQAQAAVYVSKPGYNPGTSEWELRGSRNGE